jgi:hypothetical protein
MKAWRGVAVGLWFAAWAACAQDDEGSGDDGSNQGSNNAQTHNADNNAQDNNADNNTGNNANNSDPNNSDLNNSNPNNSDPNNSDPNNSDPNNLNNTNNADNNVNNSNNSSLPSCEAGTILILEPRAGERVGAGDDTDADEPGVQVVVRLATSAPTDTFLTLENRTTDQSVGAVVEGPEVLVRGVTLAEGDNRLVGFADTPTCFAESSEVLVVLEGGPTRCEEDDQCGVGLRCEGGECARCEAACERDEQCGGGASCERGCCEGGAAPGYRFLLLEDRTPRVSGESPGADVDAIRVTTGGVERFATVVEDSYLAGDNNRFNDPSELLGPSDSGCQVQNFASLGGAELGGYAVLGFSTAQEEVVIEAGDRVKVYEVGQTLCGQFDDDPYAVSVSASTDLGSFVLIGESAAGTNQFVVPALP